MQFDMFGLNTNLLDFDLIKTCFQVHKKLISLTNVQ